MGFEDDIWPAGHGLGKSGQVFAKLLFVMHTVFLLLIVPNISW